MEEEEEGEGVGEETRMKMSQKQCPSQVVVVVGMRTVRVSAHVKSSILSVYPVLILPRPEVQCCHHCL